MDILEQYEQYISSEEVQGEFDGSQISPLPAFYAEPIIKDTLESIHREMLSYPDSFKEEPYQMYRRYQAYLRMHYELLTNVHPLTSIGTDRINKWRQAVDEYESLSGGDYPLVTTVTKKSADLVKHLIPKEYLQLIDNPKRHILCALRYKPAKEEVNNFVEFAKKENEAYSKFESGETENVSVDYSDFLPTKHRSGVVPAGVLSFVEEVIDGDKTVRIEWLYVAPEHRNAGLCNALVYEMLYIMRNKSVEGYIMDIDRKYLMGEGERHESVEPTTELLKEAGIVAEEETDFVPENEYAPLVHFVTNFKFESGPVPEDAVHIRLSDIQMTSKMAKMCLIAKEIHSLKELDDLTFRRMTQKFIIENPGAYDEVLPAVGKQRFDQDISFYFQLGAEIIGIVLARENYRGHIVVEMVQATKSPEKVMEMLLLRVITAALKKYGSEAQFVVPLHHELVIRVLESHVDDMYYRIGARAALIRPMIDVTPEEWDEFVNRLQELSPDELEELTRQAAQTAKK